MELQIIQVPYDSGRRAVRMGNGPAHLVKHTLGPFPSAQVDQIEVEEMVFELGTTFRILRTLSDKVSAAVQKHRFPLVLSGGCISCVGTLAGLGAGSKAIVWLDAHGDFNTPETTNSGFPDGMALAIATGHCWRNMAASVPGFRPVSEDCVIQIGARDFDPEEARALQSSLITRIDIGTIRKEGFNNSLRTMIENLRVDHLYLHIDLDVLDIAEARVNPFSSTGGLTAVELLGVVSQLGNVRPISAAAITAYDPSCDSDGRALQVASVLIKKLHDISKESSIHVQ